MPSPPRRRSTTLSGGSSRPALIASTRLSSVRDEMPACSASSRAARAVGATPITRVAGVLVELAQHAGGVGLAGSRERLDHVDAVARPGDGTHRRGLIAVQHAVAALDRPRRSRPSSSCATPSPRRPTAASISAASRATSSALVNVLPRRREHVVAADEPPGLRAHRVYPRALRRGRRELAQHRTLIERVGALGQTRRARSALPRARPPPLAHRPARASRRRRARRGRGARARPRRSLRRARGRGRARRLVRVISSRQVCVSIPYCLRSLVAIAPHASRSARVDGRPSSASRSATAASTCARRCENTRSTSTGTSASSAAPLWTGPHSSPSRSRTSERRCDW